MFQKKFLLLIFLNSTFLILHSFCFSQSSKIDSLLILLKTDKADTNKLNHLNELSLEYDKIGTYDSAILHANSALQLSNTLFGEATDPTIRQIVMKGEADSYDNIGNVYYDQGNYEVALKNYFAALKIYEAIDNKKGIATSYNAIGNIYGDQGNYPDALKNYFASLSIREKIGDKQGIFYSYNNIGIIYKLQGKYPEALKNYFASLKIGEATDNKNEIANSYNNIGVIYKLQGDYPEALEKFVASLKIKIAIGDKAAVASSYNNIGNVFYAQGNHKEALKNYLECLKISEAIGYKLCITYSYSSIGSIFFAEGDYSEALKNYFASLKIFEEMGNKTMIAGVYNNIGKVYIQQKQYIKAETYLNRAKELSVEMGNKEFLRDAYDGLTVLNSAKGNFKGAYENHKLYILYRDSIDNEETRKKTIESTLNYEFEKTEAVTNANHKKELENQQTLAEEKSRKQKVVIGFVVGSLLLVLVFSGFIFRSLRVTRKQKEVIEIQKIEVDHQKHLVEEKNHEISSSIAYAKRIQSSFLTSETYIKRHIADYFILYKPKDVVSGDFYWMHKQNDYFYFCISDCTGHGIPGAFMSLIGMGILNEIIYAKQISDTNNILDELRRIVILAVNPEGAANEGKDGMDLVLGRLHLQTKELQYSAANNSFYVCRKGELLEYKPDKMPIGKFGDHEKPFSQHKIQLEENDIIYTITDGYADQFGGPKGKKFKYKQLEEQLIANRDQSMENQKKNLELSFGKWKGDLEQVDDVTVVGIRI